MNYYQPTDQPGPTPVIGRVSIVQTPTNPAQ